MSLETKAPFVFARCTTTVRGSAEDANNKRIGNVI